MSRQEGLAEELESAIAGLYGGPLEEFVRRRDALVAQLRADGRRTDAAGVKALRKPARLAWVLNVTASEKETLDPLTGAVAGIHEAHAGGRELRAALGALRAAVRDFAEHAAHAASERGAAADTAVLVNAVLAVIGDSAAFQRLCAGRLEEVPEAGGLDLLAALAAHGGATPAAPVAQPAPAKHRTEDPDQETLRRAEAALAAARERADSARRAHAEAEAALESAERRLQQAEQEVRARRADRDRARDASRAAAVRLEDAEKVVIEARRPS